jgi:dTDP-4-amino-4,6-dideoxygalactose transaminase
LLTYNRLYRRAASEVSYRVSPALRMRRSDWAVVQSQVNKWNVQAERSAEFWIDVRRRLPEGWYVPPEPEGSEWNHWLLPVCGPTRDVTAQGIARLRSRGVGARLIYIFSPEGGRAYGYVGDCPEAERLSRRLFVLPAHSQLSRRERQHILESIRVLDPASRCNYTAQPKSVGEC